MTRPGTISGEAPASVLLPTPTSVHVLTRDVPIATPLSASKTLGIFGGTLSLPGSGLTVVVPAFALRAPTQITVTAVPGSQVAYEFEPHGKQFLVPLIATQSLAGTSAAAGGLLPPALYAGYFADVLDLDQLNGTALVSELLGTTINVASTSVTFGISHFSGYLIATGMDEPADSTAGGMTRRAGRLGR